MFTYRSLVPGFFVLVAGVLFFGSPAYACPQGMVCAPGKSCPPEENCVAASAPPPATAPAVNSGQAPEVREQDQEQDQGEHQLQDDNLRIETERGARELLEGDQPLPQGPVQRTYDTGTISGQIGNIQQALPQGEAAVATESALPTVSMVLTPTFTSVIEAAIKPATASCLLDSPHGSGLFIAEPDPCPVPSTAVALYVPTGTPATPRCCNVGSYSGLGQSSGFAYGSGAGVYLHSGEFYVFESDLEIPGRGFNWKLERKYRSGVIADGPLGHNWSFNYQQRLVVVSARNANLARPATGTAAFGDVLRVGGYGRVDRYRRNGDGTYGAPTAFYTALVRRPDGSFVERDYRGFTAEYGVPDGLGVARLAALADRFGNRMRFQHDERGRLRRVIETLGRAIDYFYSPEGRLIAVRDFIGRVMRFRYDANGDLAEVTSPAVTGTPNGNDFPQGRTTRYTYSSGFQEPRLNHNLTSITAPNEVATGGPPRIVVVYDTDPGSPTGDRVLSQTIGGTNRSGVPAGGTIRYAYRQGGSTVPGGSAAVAAETAVTDRNGNLRVYRFNAMGNIVAAREFSNRGLRSWEPEFYETRYEYSPEGELLRQVNPEGNAVEYLYDEANPDRLQQGNLLAVIERPDARRGGDQTFIETSYVYEPIHNEIRGVTEPRGNDPAYAPQNGGENAPARYTTAYTFDYQEGQNYRALATRLGVAETGLRRRLERAGVPMGLGDVNGDGVTDQVNGAIVRVEHPTVRLLPQSQQARLEGDDEQRIVELLAYNRFGQITRRTDPEGNVTLYAYHPANDPDGDGRDPTPGMDKHPSGYFKQMTRDAEARRGRNSGTDPAPTRLRRTLFYDRVGNIVRNVDGRGIATDYFVNQLDEVVEVVRAAAYDVLPPEPAEPRPLVDYRYRERLFYDHNGNVGLRQVEDRGDTSGVGGDNRASGTAFVDRSYRYDILDNLIEKRAEVSDAEDIVRRYRYDGNGNKVLDIKPEGNGFAWRFDERDLVFEAVRGATAPPDGALLAASDPKSYDVRGGVPSTTTRHYDKNGNQIEEVDAADTDGSAANNSKLGGAGDRTRFVYDGFDRRSSVIDAVGNQSVWQFDPAGNWVRILRFGPVGGPSPRSNGPDSLPRSVSSGGVVQARNLASESLLAATEYRYDEVGRNYQVDKVLFVNSTATVQRPDLAAGGADIGKGDLTPGDSGALPGLSAPTIIGRVTTRQEFDRGSRRTFVVEDDGDIYRTLFDGANRPIQRRDPEGNTVEYAYDDNGNVIETRETDVAQGGGTPDEIFLTTRFYDSLNRLVMVVDNLGQTTNYRYDSRNNLVAVADANGPPGPEIARRAFAPGPRTVNATNRFGNVIRYDYDGLNRRVGAHRIFTASGTGDGVHIGATLEGVKSATPPPDPTQGGGDGLISRRTAYDRNSHTLSNTDDNGNQTRYAYDNLDRRLSETNGICGGPRLADRCDQPTTREAVYDQDRNVVRYLDENGSRTECDFDAINRRTDCRIHRGAGVRGSDKVAFEYDGLSRPTRLADNNEPDDPTDDSVVTHAFDSLNRIIETGQKIGPLPTKAISSAWRAETLRVGLRFPDGRRLRRSFDGLDRLAAVADEGANGVIARYGYIGRGRIAERAFPGNGTRLTYLDDRGTVDTGYDGVRRPIRPRHLRRDGSLIVGFARDYDRADNTRVEEMLHAPGESELYDYDSAYRLIGFERGALNPERDGVARASQFKPSQGAWSLDGVGNWKRVDGARRQFSSFNELISDIGEDGSSPAYDDNGNLIDDDAFEYTWDYQNRLRAVTRKADGAFVAAYSYDALGRRVRSVTAARNGSRATTDLYHRGWRVIEERGGNDEVQRQYVYGYYLDEPLVMDRADGERVYYHQNTIHSVFGLTDAKGELIEGYQYDAYGRQTVFRPGVNGAVDFGDDDIVEVGGASGASNPFMFTGRRLDAESGLYYFRRRQFDPEMGRFLQRDSIGIWKDTVNLGNGYAYVGNNPVNRIDPLGRDVWVKSDSGHADIYIANRAADCCPEDKDVSGCCPITGYTYYSYGPSTGGWDDILGALYCPGQLSSDIVNEISAENQASRNFIQIKTTCDTEDAMRAYAESIATTPGDYNPFTNSCVDFVQDTLDEGGLTNVPSGWGTATPEGLRDELNENPPQDPRYPPTPPSDPPPPPGHDADGYNPTTNTSTR